MKKSGKEKIEKKIKSTNLDENTHKKNKNGFYPGNKEKKKVNELNNKNSETDKKDEINSKIVNQAINVKRSETPNMFMRKRSPLKGDSKFDNKMSKDKKKDIFKRRKSTYDKGKMLFKEKRMLNGNSKLKKIYKKKDDLKKGQFKENIEKTKKDRLIKKNSRSKASNSSGKSLAAFTAKRNHLKYSRGLLSHNLKKNSGQNTFQALFSTKGKTREGSLGINNNYMSNSRKNMISKNRNYKESRKISHHKKSSPKASNPYIKPNGSRNSDMLFNQNAMNRFHPPNYGVYANEHRHRFLSRFEGVFKSGNQDHKDNIKKSSHDKSKLSKHYSSLNAYEKNFYRASIQGKDNKQNALYNNHLKQKRSSKVGTSQKERNGGTKLGKFRSRDKQSGGGGVGYSYRNGNQAHSHFDNSLNKNIYEDNLYSGFGKPKRNRAMYMTNMLDGSMHKRGMGSILGGHMFMKSKNRSKKNIKRSPVRTQSKILHRPDETKKGYQSREGAIRSKKQKEHGLHERDRNRKKRNTRGELESKVTLLYRNLIKQEEKHS